MPGTSREVIAATANRSGFQGSSVVSMPPGIPPRDPVHGQPVRCMQKSVELSCSRKNFYWLTLGFLIGYLELARYQFRNSAVKGGHG
jgi:hypothetical protein